MGRRDEYIEVFIDAVGAIGMHAERQLDTVGAIGDCDRHFELLGHDRPKR